MIDYFIYTAQNKWSQICLEVYSLSPSILTVSFTNDDNISERAPEEMKILRTDRRTGRQRMSVQSKNTAAQL